MNDKTIDFPDEAAAPQLRPRFPIVGIGASAGGLDAFIELLRGLTATPDMAFVFVQHLDPRHDSLLADILGRATQLPVSTAQDGILLEANHVYVIAPNQQLALANARFRSSPRGTGPEQFMPIDHFFRSLAVDQGPNAIAVVLSGGGSDGALGLEEVKGADGVAFVQSEASAKHDAMPRNAVATGCVDFVLPPLEIAAELLRLRHALQSESRPDPISETDLHTIFALIRRSKAVDFSNYKRNTIQRRIQRRMTLSDVASVANYIALLEDKPTEIHALFQDLLIRVTSFFRDPSAFAALSHTVFPSLTQNREPGSPIRLWVAGCSTGEEVYSLAISLLEFLGDMVSNTPIKILATDVNEAALEHARAGRYIDNIALDVSPERLRRFFQKSNGHYQISKSVRDLCVFSRHNLAQDPPFANLDFITCRNLLIYFDASLQKRVLPHFHYALKTHGFLMLGTAETVGDSIELFETSDKENKIYAKRAATHRQSLYFPSRTWEGGPSLVAASLSVPDALRAGDIQREAERVLLARFVPPSVTVDASGRILHFRGQTGRYLNPVAGTASLDLLKMVREELLVSVRDAIERAKATHAPSASQAWVKDDGVSRAVEIEALPLRTHELAPPCFVVLFRETAALDTLTTDSPGKAPSDFEAELLHRDRELAALRDYLQSVVENGETTSEELRAANEEVLSSNEELQSTNEELQTAKEEMQSTNEELATVNDELNHRNSELGHLNDDLNNLLGGLNIPIIMVTRALRIRRFTQPAEPLFNLIASDLGRPISDLRPNITVANLGGLISDVINSLKPVELEVQDSDARWYSLRIRPYITTENRIDGAALAVVDIDQLKRSGEQLKLSRDYAEAIVETVWEPLVVLDAQHNFNRANAAFYEVFRTSPAEVIGRSFWEFDGARWDQPELRTRLERVLPDNERVQDFEFELTHADREPRILSLNAQRIFWGDDRTHMILLAIEDITGRKRELLHSAQLAREQTARTEAENASRIKDEFLAMLAHELRNPLGPVRNGLYLLRKRIPEDPLTRKAIEIAERQVTHMARLLDDLLDVSRITHGKIQLRRELMELQVALQNALETSRTHFDGKRQTVALDMPHEPLFLEADPTRLEQIFSNLLHNASKYTAVGGQVWVSVATEPGLVVIRVRDNGVGIAQDMLSRVFDLFAQVDRSLARSEGGLGIGLTLVKSLVDLHGGSIAVQSGGAGQGSQFVVRLPAFASSRVDSDERRAPTPSDAPGPQRRVLVVDDNVASAETLLLALELKGHEVQMAHDSKHAIEIALATKPDAVLLDIGMPGLSGYEVAQQLRAEPALAHTLIVAVTGYGLEEDRRRSAEVQIDAHLVKPVDPSEVNRLLRQGRTPRS
jgi:two-component system CheB/CheR fusion protein